MKILENMDACYGCAACANICPVGAIAMSPAQDGFLYPVVDEQICVSCGACRRVCPQLNASYENSRDPKVFAVMAGDEIRAKSASGGMFSLLAEYAFDKGGYVCGSAFAEDFRSARHVMIHEREKLDPLRRSKYIQSENGDIHKQVEEKLKAGKFVLFTGTPCQCAAVRAYLGKPYENLLLVDLICHGAPSPLAWNRFLEELAPGETIADVNFRYKELTGWSSTMHIEFEGREAYTKTAKDDIFEQTFQRNLISRKSCGSCQFARVPRQGDITMGDFWGINSYDKKLDDRKGTSAILINTEKGRKICEELQASGAFKKFQEVPFFRAFSRRNANVYRFPHSHPGRKTFFDALESGKTFSEALAGSREKKYDIVLLSIWYAANCGSVLTNFALYKVLSDLGYNCIFADIPDTLWSSIRAHRDPLFITRRFGCKHFKLTGKYKNRADLRKLNDLADTFVVGSDQIWNYSLCKSAGTFFYLDFVDDCKKKIAYGTSFGHTVFRGNLEEQKNSGFYLNRFDAVSVREDYAVDMCEDLFGVDAVKVLDPVFLCDKKHYMQCIAESNLEKNPPAKKYVLGYILDPTEEKQAALERTAERYGAELICIPKARVSENMRKKWRLPILDNLDVEDWLYYFRNAEAVVTDSFHGSCFSIIFERPFMAIGNSARGLERFYSLLNELGLMDRLVLSAQKLIDDETLLTAPIDYEAVNAALAGLREKSMKWLLDALQMEKRPSKYSSYDIAERHIDQAVKKMEDRFASLNKEVAAQAARNEKLQVELKQLIEAQKKILYMENSFSWRVTKPIRACKKLAKKILKQ